MARTLLDVLGARMDLPAVGDLLDQIQDAVLRQDLDWVIDQSAGRAPVAWTAEPALPIPIVPGLPGQQIGPAER